MEKTSIKNSANSFSEEKTLNWEEIQSNFLKSFGKEIYSSWLKDISLLKEYNHYVILGVQTRFFRDWITSRYADRILNELQKHKLSINRIEFKIIEAEKGFKNSRLISASEDKKITQISESVLNYNRMNPNLSFDNFVVGSSNKIAYLSGKKICEKLSSYNPLFIYGGVGLGKTHLMNAIGLEMSQNNKVMFISAERFMYQFIKSIKKMRWLILKIFLERQMFL